MSPLDILLGDEAAGPCALDCRYVHAEFFRKHARLRGRHHLLRIRHLADYRERLLFCGLFFRRCGLRFFSFSFGGFRLRSGLISVCPGLYLKERLSDIYNGPLLFIQPDHPAFFRRRHLDYGLVGLYVDHHLMLFDKVAGRHLPLYDLAFGYPLAEVWQLEFKGHLCSPFDLRPASEHVSLRHEQSDGKEARIRHICKPRVSSAAPLTQNDRKI